jgi:hypothetical protein
MGRWPGYTKEALLDNMPVDMTDNERKVLSKLSLHALEVVYDLLERAIDETQLDGDSDGIEPDPEPAGVEHGECPDCDALGQYHLNGRPHCFCGEDWPCPELVPATMGTRDATVISMLTKGDPSSKSHMVFVSELSSDGKKLYDRMMEARARSEPSLRSGPTITDAEWCSHCCARTSHTSYGACVRCKRG